MSSALIVGGDQVQGIKQTLANHGISEIHHWTGRKSGDANKIIPHDTAFIVLITNWINHSLTYKLKKDAIKRGIHIVYTPNGGTALHQRLERLAATAH